MLKNTCNAVDEDFYYFESAVLKFASLCQLRVICLRLQD